MRHLLVLHQGALGDFVLALSVIQSARTVAGVHRVTAIASSPSARLAPGLSVIDACLSPDQVGLHTLFGDGPTDPRLTNALGRADLILSFLSASSDEIHARLCRATTARVISVDPRPTTDTLTRRCHITEQWSAAIRAQSLSIPDPTPPHIQASASFPPSARGAIPLPPLATGTSAFPPLIRGGLGGGLEDHCQPSATTAASTRNRILIHPGSGGQSKCWPADRFFALADALRPASIHWLLGPAELDSDPNRFTQIRTREQSHREPLLIEDDLRQVASHIAGMDLYIGNDAGMTHIAAALSIPTVAIYGPTDPNVWRPLGSHVITVSPPAPAPVVTVPLEPVLSAARQSLKPLPPPLNAAGPSC